MAKKKSEDSIEVEREEAAQGKSLYQNIISSLSDLRAATKPVLFESEDLQHLNGDPEKKTGIFVRRMDIYEQDNLIKIKGARPTFHVPELIIHVALISAVAFDGTRMFDENNQEHMGLLVGVPDFANEIFWEAMFACGLYARTGKDIAKNSAETPRPSSDSGSQSNSGEPSAN